mgnify:CR=1 FL=1
MRRFEKNKCEPTSCTLYITHNLGAVKRVSIHRAAPTAPMTGCWVLMTRRGNGNDNHVQVRRHLYEGRRDTVSRSNIEPRFLNRKFFILFVLCV